MVINFQRPAPCDRCTETASNHPRLRRNERRLGVAPGGGYFGLKGIYVLTPDGMLHEQVMNTGADFAPPVKFLPAANSSPYGMNFGEKRSIPQPAVAAEAWRTAFGRSTWLHPITTCRNLFHAAGSRPLALTGPAITPDGTAFFVTGAGTSDPAAGVYAGSVISLAKDMKVQDWYTPAGGMGTYESVSPVTFEL